MLLKSHRLGHRATLEIDDLVDTPLLLTRRGFASREWFDTATQYARADRFSVVVRISNATEKLPSLAPGVRLPR